jgi:hypothetical protein
MKNYEQTMRIIVWKNGNQFHMKKKKYISFPPHTQFPSPTYILTQIRPKNKERSMRKEAKNGCFNVEITS